MDRTSPNGGGGKHDIITKFEEHAQTIIMRTARSISNIYMYNPWPCGRALSRRRRPSYAYWYLVIHWWPLYSADMLITRRQPALLYALPHATLVNPIWAKRYHRD